MFDSYTDDPFALGEREDDDFRLFIAVMVATTLIAVVVGLVVLT